MALIAEVDARRLYAREAILRIRVARASRQHPMLLTELREGRLHLSGIALPAPLLTSRNRESLLKRATHRSKEQVRELVAEISPRPDVPSMMRKLPGRRPGGPSGATAESLCPDTVDGRNALSSREMPRLSDTAGAGATRDVPADAALPSVAAAPADGRIWTEASPALSGRSAPLVAPSARPAIEPLSAGRDKVQFAASAELREKLLRLKGLMRSSVPDGDLGAIVEAAVTEKLERLEARRFGKTASPQELDADVEATPTSRHIPAAVRRAVHERDGDRCTYRDARGTRCPACHGLEFHHHGRPFGFGGVHSVRNVRLMCRAHNRLLADCDYGKEKMARFRRGTGSAEGVGADAPGGP